MAEVDFSNAIITPVVANPVELSYVSLMGIDRICDANNNRVGSVNNTIISSEEKVLIVNFQGTFSTSGTEFYILNANSTKHFRISNISFANGDTYSFKIRVDLICQ